MLQKSKSTARLLVNLIRLLQEEGIDARMIVLLAIPTLRYPQRVLGHPLFNLYFISTLSLLRQLREKGAKLLLFLC